MNQKSETNQHESLDEIIMKMIMLINRLIDLFMPHDFMQKGYLDYFKGYQMINKFYEYPRPKLINIGIFFF